MVEDAREKEFDGVIKVMASWAKSHGRRDFNTLEDYLQIGRETRVRYAEKLASLDIKHAASYLGLAIKGAILVDKRFTNKSDVGKVNRRTVLFQFPEKKDKKGAAFCLEDVLRDEKWNAGFSKVEFEDERRKTLEYIDGLKTRRRSNTKAMMRDYVFGASIRESAQKYGVSYDAASAIHLTLIRGARAYFMGEANGSSL